MNSPSPSMRLAVGLLLAPLAILGCTTEKTVPVVQDAPTVNVTGAFAIHLGDVVQLTATTTNGTDAGYFWSSSDETIATVVATGADTANVTGVTAGSVTILVSGTSTGKGTSYNMVVAALIPQEAEWAGSAHADYASEPFRHWDPGPIPVECAKCHSSTGFQDYLGADGSTPWVVDTPKAVGTLIDCVACHNSTASALSQVTFPSGVTLTGLGPEARCMTCHQGLEATDTVNAKIGSLGDDVTSPTLGFANIHYYAAGATLNAGTVRGGYQYSGNVYDVRFRHVSELDTCVKCHDMHTLKVRVDRCAECHDVPGTTYEEKRLALRNIRMQSSLAVDYDGDGDTTEGISGEIDTLREKVLTALRAVTVDQTLTQICYSALTYPYWFKDAHNSPICDPADANYGNQYGPWSPRLLRGAYNYQVSVKDPGAFAHNAKYIIELLFDSIANLNAGISNAASRVDMSLMNRTDLGHFNGAGEPARHWDSNDAVDSSCSRCHSGSAGFRYWVTYGVPLGGADQDNGLDCETCHSTFQPFPRAPPDNPNFFPVPSVLFPSAVTVKLADEPVKGAIQLTASSFICMTCHSGRESKATVDAYLAPLADGTTLTFRNVHYLAAGATLLGKEVGVAYQYGAATTYSGRIPHNGQGSMDCDYCHNGLASKHTFAAADVYLSATAPLCQGCHAKPTVDQIRGAFTALPDIDGDGNVTEPLKDEIAGLKAKVLARMVTVSGAGALCYAPDTYPYWLTGPSTNGICNAGVTTKYPFKKGPGLDQTALYTAAFNYQFVEKDPGSWAHNYKYTAEILYDTLVAVGGDTTGLVRIAP